MFPTPNYQSVCRTCGHAISYFVGCMGLDPSRHGEKCEKCGGQMVPMPIVTPSPFPPHPNKKY
jgi:hypothetical protein